MHHLIRRLGPVASGFAPAPATVLPRQTGEVRLLGDHAHEHTPMPMPMPKPTRTLTPEGRSAQAYTSEKTLSGVRDPKDDRPAKLETARQVSEALSDEGEEDS